MQEFTRRSVLVAGVSAGSLAVAGCLGDSVETVDELPVPTRGPDDAPTVSVFVDFSCPGCRWFENEVTPTLSEWVEEGDARVEHRDLPFINEWSDRVANGARAVQDHGDDDAFFSFVADIFAYQDDYRYDDIETVASDVADLGDEAREAAEEGIYDPVLEDALEHGDEAGVGGTPWVIVEGVDVSIDTQADPSEAIEDIEAMIEAHG